MSKQTLRGQQTSGVHFKIEYVPESVRNLLCGIDKTDHTVTEIRRNHNIVDEHIFKKTTCMYLKWKR
jgi:hypothetical protein